MQYLLLQVVTYKQEQTGAIKKRIAAIVALKVYMMIYLENLTLLKKFDNLADLIQLVAVVPPPPPPDPDCLLGEELLPPKSGSEGSVLIDLRLFSLLPRVRLVRLTMWACLADPGRVGSFRMGRRVTSPRLPTNIPEPPPLSSPPPVPSTSGESGLLEWIPESSETEVELA